MVTIVWNFMGFSYSEDDLIEPEKYVKYRKCTGTLITSRHVATSDLCIRLTLCKQFGNEKYIYYRDATRASIAVLFAERDADENEIFPFNEAIYLLKFLPIMLYFQKFFIFPGMNTTLIGKRWMGITGVAIPFGLIDHNLVVVQLEHPIPEESYIRFDCESTDTVVR